MDSTKRALEKRNGRQSVTQGISIASMFIGIMLCLPPSNFANAANNAEAAPLQQGQANQATSVAEVAKRAMPAVVNISTTQKALSSPRSPSPMPGPHPFGGNDPLEEFFRRFFGDRPPPSGRRSLGSGFIIINEEGYIITNNHVLSNAETITVRLSEPYHDEYQATVVGADEKTDLALIRINADRPLPTLPLGDSEELRVGEWVVAIGNSFGLEQTVTVGIVSAKGRVIGAGLYDDFIQTDASINPGNSGGPLLNLRGEVIGVNTAIFSRGGGNVGIGFAIPAALTKTVVAQLQETGAVRRAWLGVTIQAVTPELAKSFGLEKAQGALVAEVAPGSPAAQGGIERSDIIVEFNKTTIRDSHELPTLVAKNSVGATASVTVVRGGKEKTIAVKLGELQEPPARTAGGEENQEHWGMTVANITPEVARRFQVEDGRKGVIVVNVNPEGPAAGAGVRSGDVIEEINRQPINSVESFVEALSPEKTQQTVLLLVRRGDVASFLALHKVA
jgi:serine protease Do